APDENGKGGHTTRWPPAGQTIPALPSHSRQSSLAESAWYTSLHSYSVFSAWAQRPCQLVQVFFQESKNFLPPVHRLLLPIGGPVIVEEAVAGTVIPVELVGFAVLLQLLLMLVHLGRGRSLVVIAKETQE